MLGESGPPPNFQAGASQTCAVVKEERNYVYNWNFELLQREMDSTSSDEIFPTHKMEIQEVDGQNEKLSTSYTQQGSEKTRKK